ncbi:DUF1573 domain-containing protein [Aureisphaera galaxeae]|uniref:DUF1573 domain-containing protein n=1 Tax=Aureisphaera galaxeae TaxID=1538023 RepID=UPI0023501409|nr:DUF1573 domain-containing protein [Aureisphaera galaxeae]MDC8004542.1 DUF1573 domain-containing protein [Aureisphaera galaxeae]
MNYRAKSLVSVWMSFLFLCCFSFMNAQSNVEDKGILAFDQDVIEYGEVAHNSDGNRTFTFKNVGKAPVVIADIKTSCGCTVATKPTKPILPGESSEITVNYKTSKVGPFSKSITVVSNAQEGRKVLKIKGKVLEAESKS